MVRAVNLLENQIPSHIQERYPVFCLFIKYYYKYLSARQFSSVESITDIDKTFTVITVRLLSGIENTKELIGKTIQFITPKGNIFCEVLGVSTSTDDSDDRILIRYITQDCSISVGDCFSVKDEKGSNKVVSEGGVVLNGGLPVAGQITSVNTVPTIFLEEFRNMVDAFHIFDTEQNNIAQILKNIKQFYRAKGTVESIKWILRVLKEIEADVSTPWDHVLKPSDSRWSQYSCVVIAIDYPVEGRDTSGTTNAIFQNWQGDPDDFAKFSVSKIDKFNDTKFVRLYFDKEIKHAVENEPVVLYDNDSQTIAKGHVVPSVSTIVVNDSSEGWGVGRVFTLGGMPWGSVTYDKSFDIRQIPWHGRNIIKPLENFYAEDGIGIDDTIGKESVLIGKVTHTSSEGKAEYAEIIQFGEHIPLPERVEENRYTVFPSKSKIDSIWADISFEYKIEPKSTGNWLDDRGLISYSDIVLQDSFYYQQFSYDVIADVNPDEYDYILNHTHPTGTKRFNTFNAQDEIFVGASVDCSIGFFFMSVDDTVGIVDSKIAKTLIKPIEDRYQGFNDNSIIKTFIKICADGGIKFKESVWKDFRKVLTDILNLTVFNPAYNERDEGDLWFEAHRAISESFYRFEEILKFESRKGIIDKVGTSEDEYKIFTKILTPDNPEARDIVSTRDPRSKTFIKVPSVDSVDMGDDISFKEFEKVLSDLLPLEDKVEFKKVSKIISPDYVSGLEEIKNRFIKTEQDKLVLILNDISEVSRRCLSYDNDHESLDPNIRYFSDNSSPDRYLKYAGSYIQATITQE